MHGVICTKCFGDGKIKCDNCLSLFRKGRRIIICSIVFRLSLYLSYFLVFFLLGRSVYVPMGMGWLLFLYPYFALYRGAFWAKDAIHFSHCILLAINIIFVFYSIYSLLERQDMFAISLLLTASLILIFNYFLVRGFRGKSSVYCYVEGKKLKRSMRGILSDKDDVGLLTVSGSNIDPVGSGNRECPLCFETVKSKAMLCKHCKSTIEPLDSE